MGLLVNGLGASGPGGLEPIIHSIADWDRLSLQPLLRSVSLVPVSMPVRQVLIIK